MTDLQTFFAMGGHGLYVWLSYGISAAVVIAHVIYLQRRRSQFELTARARVARNASGADTAGGADTHQDPLLGQQ